MTYVFRHADTVSAALGNVDLYPESVTLEPDVLTRVYFPKPLDDVGFKNLTQAMVDLGYAFVQEEK